MSYVAFQYAEALFSLALEEKKVDQVLSNYSALIEAYDEEISKFLNHPKVSKNDKKDVVSKVITDSLLKNFVFVLIDNTRVEFLHDCFNEFKVIVDNQNKVMNVVVYSQKLLSEQELKELKNNLNKKHNRNIELTNVVDSKIIGGIRLEYEGMVLDDTINNYLSSMVSNLMK
jgi:F-type H+-transporting ATPase subunit delta